MRLADREKIPMIQAKFDLDESQFEFLNQFEQYGFRNESELIRTALTRLQQELQHDRLEESATLYAEFCESAIDQALRRNFSRSRIYSHFTNNI